MKYIINENNNPRYNLALEEYVLKNLDGEYFFLWQNEPTIVIGKHQNTISEINLDYVEKKGIHVVRRMSGGGAVYHDLGNINFSFIQEKKDLADFDFSFFTRPIVDLLGELGIKAEFNSRNDLAIDGKKFSGNAQYIFKKKILHHGTLLFNSEMEELVNSLKGVSSRRLREWRPEVAGRYCQGVLWSPSYFVASCGDAPLSIIAEYIKSQRETAYGRPRVPSRPQGRGFPRDSRR